MKKVVVTGVTGKSGIYFYQELCKNAYQLTDFEFYFVVRNQAKAEEMLQCTQLNQHLLIGSLNDKQFVNTIFAMEGIHTLLHIAGIDKSLPFQSCGQGQHKTSDFGSHHWHLFKV